MKYLLDTHRLLWFLSGDEQLSAPARQLIENESNEMFISVASLWEIAIKVSLRKLHLGQPFEKLFPFQLEQNSIEILDISLTHLSTLSRLPFHHRDPFDRLIIAQSFVENLPIIGVDGLFDAYSVQRQW